MRVKRKDRDPVISSSGWRGLLLRLRPSHLFVLLSAVGAVSVLLIFFFGHGDRIDWYFIYDTHDTGMDFFHSIEYTRGRSPYAVRILSVQVLPF